MTELQKLQTLAFWMGLLVSTMQNQIEMDK